MSFMDIFFLCQYYVLGQIKPLGAENILRDLDQYHGYIYVGDQKVSVLYKEIINYLCVEKLKKCKYFFCFLKWIQDDKG